MLSNPGPRRLTATRTLCRAPPTVAGIVGRPRARQVALPGALQGSVAVAEAAVAVVPLPSDADAPPARLHVHLHLAWRRVSLRHPGAVGVGSLRRAHKPSLAKMLATIIVLSAAGTAFAHEGSCPHGHDDEDELGSAHHVIEVGHKPKLWYFNVRWLLGAPLRLCVSVPPWPCNHLPNLTLWNRPIYRGKAEPIRLLLADAGMSVGGASPARGPEAVIVSPTAKGLSMNS